MGIGKFSSSRNKEIKCWAQSWCEPSSWCTEQVTLSFAPFWLEVRLSGRADLKLSKLYILLSSWKPSSHCTGHAGQVVPASNLAGGSVYCPQGGWIWVHLKCTFCRTRIWECNREGSRKRRIWRPWELCVVWPCLQLDNSHTIFHGYEHLYLMFWLHTFPPLMPVERVSEVIPTRIAL